MKAARPTMIAARIVAWIENVVLLMEEVDLEVGWVKRQREMGEHHGFIAQL